MKNYFVLAAFVLLAFVLGAVVGHFTAPAPQPARSGGGAAATCGDSTESCGPKVHKPERGNQERPAQPGNEKPGLKSAIDAIATPEPPSGTGVIRGVVAMGDGSAVAGVTITGIAIYPEGKNSKSADIEDEVRAAVERRRFHDALDRKAVTDARGEFELRGIPACEYRVSAEKPGFRFEDKSYAWRAKAGDRLKFEAAATISVRIEVVTFNSAALPANIELEYTSRQGNHSTQRSAKWTPEQPTLELDPGAYTLSATGGVEKEYRAEEVRFTVALEAPAPAVKLVLNCRPGIRGRVITSADFEGQEFDVTCIRYEGTAPTDGRVSGKDDHPDKRRDVASERSSYRYSLPDLPPGNYAVFLVVGRKTVLRELLTLTDAIIERDLTAPVPSRADYVVVRCYGPDGKALSSVRFNVSFESARSSHSGSSGDVLVARDGAFWVPLDIREEDTGEEQGKYYLTATTDKLGSRKEAFDPSSQSELVIRFLNPARLIVTVRGYSDSQHKEKLSVYVKLKGNDGGKSSNGIDAAGNVEFTELAPGEYTVQLSMKFDERRGSQAIATETVSLQSGDNKASIGIPPLYTLKVRTDPPKAKVRFSLQTMDRNARLSVDSRTDENGVATFENLPAGKYIIARDRDFMNVTVPETLDVIFAPMVVNALSVEVTDEKGYAASLGLATGDLIVGVNGKEFTGIEQLGEVMQKAMSEKKAKLDIQRGGSRLEIECDVSRLFSEGGCNWAPATR